MNNKMLIILIVIIAAVTVVIVSWRTPTNTNVTPTPTPTATPTVTDPFAATPTVTTSATPTPSVTTTATPTPTVTTTATPTPTPTPEAGAFEDIRDTAWIYGVTQQTVSGSVYFIDSTNKKLIKKGTSVSDSSAVTVFTSVNNGEVGSFYVNGGSMYVATKRDASTSYSRLQKVALSSGSVAKLYEFFSTKYEVAQFSVRKNNDTKTSFYIGLKGVGNASAPAAMYIKGYAQQWIHSFVGVDKTSSIIGLSPTMGANPEQLAGLFLVGSTQTQAYMGLE